MSLIDVILPPACAGCGAPGALLCDRCRAATTRPWDATERFITPDSGIVVGEAMVLGMAAFGYDGPMRRILAALKYAGTSRVAGALAELTIPTLERLIGLTGPAVLVPVPLHPDRLRQRGYNQAEVLARALSRLSGAPWRHALVRSRQTARQHRLNRAARLANLQDAFAADGPSPAVVILVDDIITTTATIEACAAVLRSAGAEEVYGIAVAREV